jgi:hypothetical protein
MVISDKQQEANRQNAQHSTGPNTPEAKAAVRLNALTYGLRARDLILPNEDSEEYKQLWADLEAEWQPQNRTERMHLEQMSTSQWLLARFAKSERRIYVCETSVEKQLALLDRVSTQTRAPGAFLHHRHAGIEAVTKGAPGPAPAAADRANRASRRSAGFEASRAKGSAPGLSDVARHRGPSGPLLPRHTR